MSLKRMSYVFTYGFERYLGKNGPDPPGSPRIPPDPPRKTARIPLRRLRITAVAGKLVALHWLDEQGRRRVKSMHPTSARATAVADKLVALHWLDEHWLDEQGRRRAKSMHPLSPRES